MEPGERDYVKTELERRLFFVDFADIHFISALHGTGVGHLYKSVQAAFKSAVTRWPTSRLTQILEDAVSEHQHRWSTAVASSCVMPTSVVPTRR